MVPDELRNIPTFIPLYRGVIVNSLTVCPKPSNTPVKVLPAAK